MIKKLATLQTTADVFAGLSDEDNTHGPYQYGIIQPSCFQNFDASQQLLLIKRSHTPPLSHLLNTGDILIKRLNPGAVIYFEDMGMPVVASQNVFVIRANTSKILSSYLGYLLEQPSILSQLSQISGSASAIRAISVKSLSKLELPIVPMEQQRVIGELWLLCKKRKRLLDEYAQQSERLLAAVYSEILR